MTITYAYMPTIPGWVSPNAAPEPKLKLEYETLPWGGRRIVRNAAYWEALYSGALPLDPVTGQPILEPETPEPAPLPHIPAPPEAAESPHAPEPDVPEEPIAPTQPEAPTVEQVESTASTPAISRPNRRSNRPKPTRTYTFYRSIAPPKSKALSCPNPILAPNPTPTHDSTTQERPPPMTNAT